jgi:cellobiose phosphorylase
MLGFRDIVQQSQGALMFHADDKPRRRLMQALSHQHRNGLGVRSFPTVHTDSKMRYSDSSLWLVFALTEYLKESGDFSLLKEGIPFLDGGKDTAWGHLKRAMDTLWKDRGARGLCRIHQGDWNDSLTHVGREGRGESVWLTQAFCAACLRMEELARYLGDGRQASLHVRRHSLLTKVLNSKAWDGGWYVRAFDDDGKPIGSKRNRYGRIFLNTQTWALLSHTVPARRIKTMLKNTRRFLWTPYGYSLLHPTYMERRDNVGRLSCVEPGCAENGSVYTHGNAFLAVALLEHGMAEEGFEAIRRIMPCNPENPSDSVIPFQLANGYGGPAHRTDPGRAAYGWSTGSGAWLHQAMVEYLFGLRRTYDGLVLRPCLPASWRDVSVSRVYRGTTYRVRCRRRKGKGNRILSLEIDGRSADPCAPLPVRKGRGVEVDVRL